MKYQNYTEEQVRDAVTSSKSKRQVLIKLGLAPKGGNYKSLDRTFKKLNIDSSHFTGQGWNKGKTFEPTRPIEAYLSNTYSIASFSLKRRLLREGIFTLKCSKCKRTKWLGKDIPLELEHIDGNSNNNNLNNLCLLCPNCHAFTPTYRGKNKGRSTHGRNRTS